MNKTVLEVLKTIPTSETVYYRSNPGNAGDALIAAGTFQLFDSLNLKIEFIEEGFNAENKTVVYAGGGNLNHLYGDARSFIEKIHKKAKQFILLPHTITANEDLLENLGENCIIFAREKVSFEHISKYKKGCEVFIDNDMALHLDIKKILSTSYSSSFSLVFNKIINKLSGKDVSNEIPSIKKLLEVSLFEFKSQFVNKKKGLFFRDDVEAAGNKLPDGNADLSVIYEFGTRSRAIIDYTVWKLLNYINQFDAVETDRLHVSVGSALLNKPVNFHPNSYFKCKAVYEYSLKERFPSINWQDN